MDKTDFLKKIKACGTLIHDKHINIDSLVGDINKSTNIEKTDKILQFCLEFENIYFSILIKAVILVLDVVLAKEIPMWFAIFGDIGVCLIAVANSARAIALGKFKK